MSSSRQYRSWSFPRDPRFAVTAGRVPDLYARGWQNKPLRPGEPVVSAAEQTSVQARIRRHCAWCTSLTRGARLAPGGGLQHTVEVRMADSAGPDSGGGADGVGRIGPGLG